MSTRAMTASSSPHASSPHGGGSSRLLTLEVMRVRRRGVFLPLRPAPLPTWAVCPCALPRSPACTTQMLANLSNARR